MDNIDLIINEYINIKSDNIERENIKLNQTILIIILLFIIIFIIFKKYKI